MKRFVVFICLAMLFWFSIHVIYLTYDGLTDHLAVVDVAVVLGNTINPDGTPSRPLQGRLDEGLELYKKGYFKKIIVSGARGKAGFVESEVMGKYLEEHGLPEETLILDKRARNTFETAVNTKRIMAEHRWKTMMIITQAYHITRTKLAFRRVGMRPRYSAHARYFESRDIFWTIREFFGFYKYLFIRERGYQ